MKSIVISGLAIVIGLIGLVWWSNSKTASAPENFGAINALTVSEESYDFGTISMKNGIVDHVFKVTNASDKDVFIKKVATSCMCTKAYIEKADGKEMGPFGMEGMGFVPPADVLIKAGESRNVRVVYDPNAHGPAGVGAIDRLVYLADASGEKIQMEIKAMVTP